MEEQNRVFARNLNNLISMSGKSQKEVALELGFNPTTFNTWCVGKIMPSLGKIQRIADYFNVGKSALTDDVPELNAIPVITAPEIELIKAYRELPEARKEAIRILCGVQK